jgi:hypothetical protein
MIDEVDRELFLVGCSNLDIIDKVRSVMPIDRLETGSG